MKKCRVGVLLSRNYQFHCTIAEGIRRIMRHNPDFSITQLLVTHNQDSVRYRVLDSIRSADPFDVFVSIGQRSSIHLSKVFHEISETPPVIHVGLRDPLALNLIDSLSIPGRNATAVMRQAHEVTPIAEKIVSLAPFIKRVLIPFWPQGEAGYIGTQVHQVAEYLRGHNVTVKPLPLESREDTLESLKNNISARDCVLFLEGAGNGGVIREAAYACLERDALLFADGLEAIMTGAGIVFGGDLYPFAIGVEQILNSFFYDKTPIGFIPVVVLPNNMQFVANAFMLRAIGVPDELINGLQQSKEMMLIKKWINCPVAGISYGE